MKPLAILGVVLAAWSTAAGQIKTITGPGGSSGARITTGVRDNKPPDPEAERQAYKEACTERLDRAERLLAEKQYAAANEALRSANSYMIERPLAERAAGIAYKLNDIGKARLAEAEQALARNDYKGGMKLLREIAYTYEGLPASQSAQARLTELGQDPTVKSAMQEDKAQELLRSFFRILDARAAAGGAASAPASAPAADVPQRLAALPDADLLRAAELLEQLFKTFDGTDAAGKAASWLEKFCLVPANGQRLARLKQDNAARQLLVRGEAYLKAGMNDKAAELFRQVLKEHAGSPHAARAAEHLGTAEARSGK